MCTKIQHLECVKVHPPSASLFVHTSLGSNLSVMLYLLVVLPGTLISSAWTTSIFSDQTISKCSHNLILVVEQTGSCLVLTIYNFAHVIIHVVWIRG